MIISCTDNFVCGYHPLHKSRMVGATEQEKYEDVVFGAERVDECSHAHSYDKSEFPFKLAAPILITQSEECAAEKQSYNEVLLISCTRYV